MKRMYKILFITMISVLVVGIVNLSVYATVDVKPGFFDDQVENFIDMLDKHPDERTINGIQAIIDSGGLSPDKANDVQQAVNRAREKNESTVPKQTEDSGVADQKVTSQQPKACDHTYEAKVTKDSTCEVEGEVTYTCTKCGHVYSEILSAVNHSYTEEIIREPQCMDFGEMKYTCSVCGVSFSEQILQTGHDLDKWVIVQEEKCMEKGKMAQYCKTCGEEIEVQNIPARGHVADDWVVLNQATLITSGREEQRCVECNELLSFREIPINNLALIINILSCVGIISIIITVVILKKHKKKEDK